MHAHTHSHDDPVGVPKQVRNAIWATVGVCGLLIVIGLVALWPGSSDGVEDPLGLEGDPLKAKVTSAQDVACSYDPAVECRLIELVMSEGDRRGETFSFEQSSAGPIRAGDGILVDLVDVGDGTVQAFFYDFQRTSPMLLLLAVFVAAILILGRLRGLGALAGLAASLFVIVMFVLPAILDGKNAVTVALVAAGAIAFIALFLAHGFNLASAAALLSSIASLAITAALALLFVELTKLTGLADDSIGFLGALGADINPQGLLLAGVVIGSLGVLDDVTVTQVSAVFELKRARPSAEMWDLYRRAVRIGRDHISSTVNTLFLAYAGAALPLLLLFREAGQSISSVATREVVAVEIVRALVGSIGLVASVPISTALAAAVVGRVTDQHTDQHSEHRHDDAHSPDGTAETERDFWE